MRRAEAVDAAAAGVLVAGCLTELAWREEPLTPSLVTLGTSVAVLLFVVPVGWWRSRPWAATVVAACAGPVLLITGATFLGMPVTATGGLVAVAFGAGDRLPRGHAVAALSTLLVGIQGAVEFTDDGLPIPVYFIFFPWLVGRAIRSRRELTEELLHIGRELAGEQRRHLQLAVLRERRRVARELHDSVGHAMSLIVIQATAGRHLAAHSPQAARQSLDAIGDVAEQARTELWHLRNVVASDDDIDRLAALPALLIRARSGGVSVTVHGPVTAPGLTPHADRVAYRVIREALTNAMRYAPGADVTIELRSDGPVVELTVTNSAPSPNATASDVVLAGVGTGTGLTGLCQDVAECAGTLHAGPSGAGWTVQARLPSEPSAASATR